MLTQPYHRILAAALALAVLLGSALPVFATETTPTETVPVETVPAETVPAETIPAETVPEETVPPETEPPVPPLIEADPDTAVYQICEDILSDSEARFAIVYHTGTGQVLYAHAAGNGKLFPASITKLFTAYVALQYLDPDTVVTAGSELKLVEPGSSLAWIARGHQIKVKMLVEGMLLPSGNDAAMVLSCAAGRVIAEDPQLAAADAVQVFVDEMNRQAELLGFEMSHFVSPDGWHTGSHYTCLNDLARIASLALQNDTIRRYMKIGYHETNFHSGQAIAWENTNLLVLPGSGFYRSDALGMKTGYTRPAGYSLMSAFSFEEGDIVIGLFGYADKTMRFDDAIDLYRAVRDQLRLQGKSSESVG